MRIAIDLAVLLAALVLGTLIAELLGADDLGTALTFGVIAFAISLVAILLRRP